MRGTITLIGMMGAGKSAVGAELGRQLAVPFRDSDTEIERAAAMTIPEIFARDGEAFFRDREAQVIARLLGSGPMVLAIGGGAWLRRETRASIREAGAAVWLDPPLDVLWTRLRGRGGGNRPLLANTDDPRGRLEALHATRAPIYARATLRVPIRGEDTIEGTARAVRAALAAHDPAFLGETT